MSSRQFHDRVSHVSIHDIDGPALAQLLAAMHQPLPTLKNIFLRTRDNPVKVLPETFLGGSAPLLEYFHLDGIPFPTFPKFISSSTHLRDPVIRDMPHSGYISPNTMVACLAALPNLEELTIEFRPPLHRTRRITPPPRTRIVLPALTVLCFRGVSEYFENFVVQIDTPLLEGLGITFITDFTCDIPRLRHFIERSERLRPLNKAVMDFYNGGISINSSLPRRFMLDILCNSAIRQPNWQLSSMVQIFGQQLPFISHVEELTIHESTRPKIEWINPDMDSPLWLELFHLFIAVQSLHLSENLGPPVVAVLQDLTGERATEVLPALRSLSFDEFSLGQWLLPEGIKSFVAARQLSDHPVAV
jgi:hypothetical protein